MRCLIFSIAVLTLSAPALSGVSPGDQKEADFAREFASKSLVTVTRVEKTDIGKRVHLSIGLKKTAMKCTVDVVQKEGKPFSNIISCKE